MNKKEISEIKKAIRPDTCCLTDIAIHYVSLEDGPRKLDKCRFLSLEEDKMFKYLEIAKKSLSGKLGKNMLELAAADPHAEAIASGSFQDAFRSRSDEDMEAVCELISENYISETDYCIIFLFGTYDVPCSTKKGDEFLGSDDVYEFMQCIIVPVALSKPGLAVNLTAGKVEPKELFHEIEAPVYAFLYPAFTDRASDVDHVMLYTKNAKNIPESLIRNLLHAAIPSSPDIQQDAFCKIVKAGFGEKTPFDVARGIYENLAQKYAESECENKVSELSSDELINMVKMEANDNGFMFDEDAAKEAAESEGGASFVLENILPASLTLQTDNIAVKIPRENIYRLERRVIGDVDYYLIPAAGSVLENIETANKNEVQKKS